MSVLYGKKNKNHRKYYSFKQFISPSSNNMIYDKYTKLVILTPIIFNTEMLELNI